MQETLKDPLYFSAGATLREFLLLIGDPRLQGNGPGIGTVDRVWPPPKNVLTALARTTLRNSVGSPLYFVLAVPHTAAGVHHLLTGRFPPAVADALRDASRQLGIMHEFDPNNLRGDAPIEWCTMSDERPQITTRRDAGRPVSAFAGKRVHIWGCGGIGSWVAEFVARAGASQISLCDDGRVAGGLLVRQNYVEEHVGLSKAEALADRLRAISDDIEVTVHARSALTQDTGSWQNADVLIDATVNTALAHLLDASLTTLRRKPLVAQLATDVRTGTLGVLSVAASKHPAGPDAIDADTGKKVLADPGLERFHVLWQEPLAGDEIVPARGCSVPTFHGSAADLAAIAGTLVTLLAFHLDNDESGTHVVALPHAEGEGPSHLFLRTEVER